VRAHVVSQIVDHALSKITIRRNRRCRSDTHSFPGQDQNHQQAVDSDSDDDGHENDVAHLESQF
jgi:hypothetical protein